MEEKAAITPNKRFWEIDFLRGIAILMMIVFHFMFDLNYFGIFSVDVYSGFWWLFARITAIIFIFLVGVSLTLSYSRARKKMTGKQLTRKYLLRGLRIFGYGLLITLTTWLFLPNGFIIFGVLHFIGIAIIISRPFLGRTWLNLLLGLVLICIGIGLQLVIFSFPWLMWLGLRPAAFYTLDYFPLLPWFGLVLIGIFFGNKLYPAGGRMLRIWERSKPPISQLCFLGRHSLLIYLIHQPILIAVLFAMGLQAF